MPHRRLPTTTPPPRLLVEDELLAGDTLLLRVVGELDLHTSTGLSQHLRGAVARELDVIVDMSDVTFMDSTGVAVLLNALRRLTRRQRRLLLAAPSGPVRKVLELTGLKDTFSLRHTVRAARATLRQDEPPMRRTAR